MKQQIIRHQVHAEPKNDKLQLRPTSLSLCIAMWFWAYGTYGDVKLKIAKCGSQKSLEISLPQPIGIEGIPDVASGHVG
jgi:hypothetical protein